MKLAAAFLAAFLSWGCSAEDVSVVPLQNNDIPPDAGPPPPAAPPAGGATWANCGHPWAFPLEACQIATTPERLAYTLSTDAHMVTEVSVLVDPRDGHYGEPARRPRVALHRFDTDNGSVVDYEENVDETALDSYDKPHRIYVDVPDFIPGPRYVYVIDVEGESGAYSMNGLRVLAPTIEQDP